MTRYRIVVIEDTELEAKAILSALARSKHAACWTLEWQQDPPKRSILDKWGSESKRPHVIVLDYLFEVADEMMDLGATFAKMVHERYPEILIVFVTRYKFERSNLIELMDCVDTFEYKSDAPIKRNGKAQTAVNGKALASFGERVREKVESLLRPADPAIPLSIAVLGNSRALREVLGTSQHGFDHRGTRYEVKLVDLSPHVSKKQQGELADALRQHDVVVVSTDKGAADPLLQTTLAVVKGQEQLGWLMPKVAAVAPNFEDSEVPELYKRGVSLAQGRDLGLEPADRLRWSDIETLLTRRIESQYPKYKSATIAGIIEQLRLYSRGPESILITGESGTGKEGMARLVSTFSPRRPFVTVFCSGVPDTLIDDMLFGHVKGAYSGADEDKVGMLKQADGGIAFMDEVGDIPLETQTKLLRAVQFGEVAPLGEGGKTERVDVKFICATNKDLGAMVGNGEFRLDLLYRIGTYEIHIPPLRDRPEDIAPIATAFNRKLKPCKHISEDALERLRSERWPGNVRELQQVILRARLVDPESPYITLSHVERVFRAKNAIPARPRDVVDDLAKIIGDSVRTGMSRLQGTLRGSEEAEDAASLTSHEIRSLLIQRSSPDAALRKAAIDNLNTRGLFHSRLPENAAERIPQVYAAIKQYLEGKTQSRLKSRLFGILSLAWLSSFPNASLRDLNGVLENASQEIIDQVTARFESGPAELEGKGSQKGQVQQAWLDLGRELLSLLARDD